MTRGKEQPLSTNTMSDQELVEQLRYYKKLIGLDAASMLVNLDNNQTADKVPQFIAVTVDLHSESLGLSGFDRV